MNELDIYTQVVMAVIKGLKSECEKSRYCLNCKLENKNEGICCFRACPCDYDLQVIENAIKEILKSEMREKQ